MSSPKRKRTKYEIQDPIKIKSILPEELTREIPLENVFICKVMEKKHISALMRELTVKLPLPPTLQHLKRVRQNEIIICREGDLRLAENIEERDNQLKCHLQCAQLTPNAVANLCAQVQLTRVPATAPRLRWQYDAVQRHWPCKFHPDKYLEALNDGSIFNSEAMEFHTQMVHALRQLTYTFGAEEAPFGICVVPRTHSIVALAGRNHKSPVMHAPMLLLDYVARSQQAGAWNARSSAEEFLADIETEATITCAGIPKRYFECLKIDQHLLFGAERLKPLEKKIPTAVNTDVGSEDNLSKYGPYLCTGYDVYLSCEPCLMCAMALVHSRVRRVFFVAAAENGALCGDFKLHAVKELNHHYEVFQCTDVVENEVKDKRAVAVCS